ncbi:GDSL esterase/lipase 4-like, partial [Solanum stenotomum]|uniref:GDSL esterase/lipase 4-like n=1 Tax=Solanum stenotomum TaxID=172797 RepID=UPI0020D0DB63
MGIFISNKPDLTITAYCDSDWTACPNSKKSVSGYLVLMGDSPISWKSKKQATVSLSSAMVEYRAVRQVVGELVVLPESSSSSIYSRFINRGIRLTLTVYLKTQLKLFQNVAQLLKNKVGEIESKQILSNAVYIFSTASNDFLFPLLANLTSPYSDTEYLHMVMGNLTSVLKGVYKQGGRKFVMFNLGPLGCLPSMRALNLQKGVKNGSCMEKATNKAKMFNSALPKMLKKLEKQLPGFKYTIFNFFKVLADSIHNPTKYGFKISETACCGMGPFRWILSCGGKRRVKEYKLCENVKDYFLFDSFHPTELAYQQYTKLLWNGTPDVVAPYNLESFFKLSTSSSSS